MEDVGQRTTSGTTGDGGSTTGSSSRNGGLARSWGDLAPTAENEADGGLAEAVDKKEPGEDQPTGVARCRENEVPESDQGASDAKYIFEVMKAKTLATIHDGSPYAEQLVAVTSPSVVGFRIGYPDPSQLPKIVK